MQLQQTKNRRNRHWEWKYQQSLLPNTKHHLEAQQKAEDEDDDIFGGVGADYDPLADISDVSDDEKPSDGAAETTDATSIRVEPKAEPAAESANGPFEREFEKLFRYEIYRSFHCQF